MKRFFIIEGRAVPKERPRFYKGKATTPKKTLAYEKKVKKSYLFIYKDEEKLTKENSLKLKIFLFFKNNKIGDLDNYIKSISDGLNKIAWDDDKQVKRIEAYIIVDKKEEERAEVFIEILEEDYIEEFKKIFNENKTNLNLLPNI